MPDTTKTCTFSKLRDDSWGARCTGFVPAPGDVLYVTKRDGSTVERLVASVAWDGTDRRTGERVVLVALGAMQDRAPARTAQPQRDLERATIAVRDVLDTLNALPESLVDAREAIAVLCGLHRVLLDRAIAGRDRAFDARSTGDVPAPAPARRPTRAERDVLNDDQTIPF